MDKSTGFDCISFSSSCAPFAVKHDGIVFSFLIVWFDRERTILNSWTKNGGYKKTFSFGRLKWFQLFLFSAAHSPQSYHVGMWCEMQNCVFVMEYKTSDDLCNLRTTLLKWFKFNLLFTQIFVSMTFMLSFSNTFAQLCVISYFANLFCWNQL